jgi:hypothetical protein
MAVNPDPNIPETDKHPGAPPDAEKRRIGEDPRPEQERERVPLGNGGTNEPAVFPPHN